MIPPFLTDCLRFQMFGVMHFLQEEKIYVSLATKLYVVVGAVSASWLLPKIGPFHATVGGLVLIGLGPVAFVSLPGKMGAYVSPLLSTLGSSIQGPAGTMYMASVFQPSDITRFQGTISTLVILPALFAGPTFTALFYGDKARMDQGFLSAAVRDRPTPN